MGRTHATGRISDKRIRRRSLRAEVASVSESLTFNLDCMEAMKQFPDKFFDLAVVDPPYGSGLTEGGGCQGWFSKYHQDSSQYVNVERERERRWNRFGQRFDRYKYPLPEEERQTTGRELGLRELEEDGARNTIRQKNYCVGRCAETGIF